jgi:hypothetical protein
MAGLAKILSVDVVTCGFLISALSNALLALAVFATVLHFARSWRFAALSALAVAMFPANWIDSLSLLPDALCTSVSFAAIAVVVRGRSVAAPRGMAGALLGAAWLPAQARC